jgi:uncharacterized membrane protein YhhN
MVYYFHIKTLHFKSKAYILTKLALGFGVVGDVFLMLKGDKPFFYGVLAFMIGQILYIAAFTVKQKNTIRNTQTNIILTIVTLIIVAGGVQNCLLFWPLIKSDKITITIYTIVIAGLVASALQRYGYTNNRSYYLTVLGALLFAISDNILAYFKFNNIKSIWGQVAVMITYYFGQYFIMHGMIASGKV